mmetsp:Transcript_16699/g.23549  ORF Transcript_16699/g.23549 Transcript_16699/m.23549 type:complete len:475 (-) Transcript_16699:39-1463(-)
MMMIQPRSAGAIITTLFLVGGLESSCAFTPRSFSSFSDSKTTADLNKFPSNTSLHLSSPNQYDISKPVFDILCFRSVRGDALIRYSSLNQSEPLRINLYALLALTLFAAPVLSEAVGNEEMGTVGTVASTFAGLGSFGLFFRETRKRNKQLVRIEKELNTGNLQVRLPMNALSDQRFTKPATLTQLKALSNPPRIISICGSKKELQDALKGLAILGKRLRQATAFVVVIPTDGSKPSDWNLPVEYPAWLAEAHDLPSWQTYFDELSPDESSSQFRWFGLNSSGRSFGSGAVESPEWLQVLGQHLRPTDILDESDNGIDDEKVQSVIKAQNQFYQALTTGNLEEMNRICSSEGAASVSQVIDAGGRIDDWKACLADGARPEGMVISGSDALIVSDTEAYSTVVEFSTNTGVDTATLLALQRWGRSSASEDWQLQLHETIPWSPEAKAQGTLRCDCRGCVALTRSPERRTFGGLIG